MWLFCVNFYGRRGYFLESSIELGVCLELEVKGCVFRMCCWVLVEGEVRGGDNVLVVVCSMCVCATSVMAMEVEGRGTWRKSHREVKVKVKSGYSSKWLFF